MTVLAEILYKTNRTDRFRPIWAEYGQYGWQYGHQYGQYGHQYGQYT